MKKVTYIVLGLSLVAVFSCQKECIKPNMPVDNVQAEWNTSDTAHEKALTGGNTGTGTDTGTVTTGSGVGTDGDITDPNNDPDKIKKKGK